MSSISESNVSTKDRNRGNYTRELETNISKSNIPDFEEQESDYAYSTETKRKYKKYESDFDLLRLGIPPTELELRKRWNTECAKFFKYYYKRICRIIACYGIPRCEHGILADDVLMKVFKDLGNTDVTDIDALRKWMNVAINNSCLNWIRQNRNRTVPLDFINYHPSVDVVQDYDFGYALMETMRDKLPLFWAAFHSNGKEVNVPCNADATVRNDAIKFEKRVLKKFVIYFGELEAHHGANDL